MKIFSVPADFSEKAIDVYNELNQKYTEAYVGETYGQITKDYMHMSGRAVDSLPQIGIRELERYVNYSLRKGIKFNYTLNAACFGNYEFTDGGVGEIKSLLKDLDSIGVTNLTLATPSIIEMVRDFAPNMEIKVSAICQVDSVMKMKHYIDLGVERFVVEPSITKEFDILRNMVQHSDGKMEIIINDKCMKNCPYKIFHYNQTAHDNNERAESYYFMNCGMRKSRNLQWYLNLNWIRPEDIHLYENMGIQYYKIEGREFILKGDIIRLLNAYIEEKFEGNLIDLLHIFAPYDTEHQPYIDNKALDGYVDAFYHNKITCNQLCEQCGYCKRFMQKSYTMPESLGKEAYEFYLGKNQFIQRLRGEK